MRKSILFCVLLFPFFAFAEEVDYKKCWDEPNNPQRGFCFEKAEDHYFYLLEKAEAKALRQAAIDDKEGMPRDDESSILNATKQSNQDFRDFLNSECRKIMLRTLPGNAAGGLMRTCEIELINWRLKQLKSESRQAVAGRDEAQEP